MTKSKSAVFNQWYTPPDLAEKVVNWTLRNHPNINCVIEPSAGQGALIKPLVNKKPEINVIAYEIDPKNIPILNKIEGNVLIYNEDYFDERNVCADIAIMNPPYEESNDVWFVRKSFVYVPVVVAILRGVIKHGLERWNSLWVWTDIVREVNLIRRPKFGGEYTAKQDFVILELVKRKAPRRLEEQMKPKSVEWW
jgi:predicted RNA methylase